MFGLNYHHQPSGGGNVSMDLSVDLYNLYDSDFYNFSINASSSSSLHAASNIFHNSTQTLGGPELSTQVPPLTYYHLFREFSSEKNCTVTTPIVFYECCCFYNCMESLLFSHFGSDRSSFMSRCAIIIRYGSSNFFTQPNATRVP